PGGRRRPRGDRAAAGTLPRPEPGTALVRAARPDRACPRHLPLSQQAFGVKPQGSRPRLDRLLRHRNAGHAGEGGSRERERRRSSGRTAGGEDCHGGIVKKRCGRIGLGETATRVVAAPGGGKIPVVLKSFGERRTIMNPPPNTPNVAEPTWDVARLFPDQGTWSEEEYLEMNANRLLEFSHGYL